jgi:hypothetical protein
VPCPGAYPGRRAVKCAKFLARALPNPRPIPGASRLAILSAGTDIFGRAGPAVDNWCGCG